MKRELSKYVKKYGFAVVLHLLAQIAFSMSLEKYGKGESGLQYNQIGNIIKTAELEINQKFSLVIS